MFEVYKKVIVSVLILFTATYAWAQHKYNCGGRVTDQDGEALECATVSLNQALYTVTDAEGTYDLGALPSGTYTYRISMVGFETVTGQVVIANRDVRLNVTLKELSLQLTDVTVTAQQVQMGSKSVIDQEAIRHIQPKSIGDLLQLVPGNLVQNPNLNNLAQAQIRELDGDYNNAMGASIVVDGMPIGNDANLEVLSATKYQEQSDGNGGSLNAHTTAGRGIDLRTVSTGNIESIEVIRGIPSVEYGNLTSGVLVVNSKAGYTPWEAKIQIDPNSKLAYLSKGLRLRHGGAINLAADWAQSWADTRLHYKGYDRITASAGYSNRWGATTFNVHAAFYTSVNDAKRDPQMTESYSEWTNDNTGGRLGINGRYRSSETFITGIDYKLSANIARQHDWMSNWIYNPDGVITNTRQEGVQEAWFKRTGYRSEYEIESIPVDAFAQVSAHRYMTLPHDGYTDVKAGLEYTMSANIGEGLTYDQENPPQAMSAERLRPRPYGDIPGLHTLSAYLSDHLTLHIETRALTADAGIRLSDLLLDRDKSGGNDGYLVAEPRANLSLSILNSHNNSVWDDLSVTGGYGLSHKMPTLLYLYPDCAYFDHVALGRWSDDESSRLALIQTTIVRETANADLRPMRARKWELGLSLAHRRNRLTLTYYNEHHTREYGFLPQVMWIDYPFYTVPNGATDLSYDAATGQVQCMTDGTQTTADCQTYTERISWSKPGNTSSSRKQGIEYTLSLAEWRPLHTQLVVNGAWIYTKRKSHNRHYMNVNVNTRLNPANLYMVVLPSGTGYEHSRLNSNFSFVTHLPALSMVITTTLQVVWNETEQSFWEDEDGHSRYWAKEYSDKTYMVVTPEGYYDMQGNWSEWSEADAENPMLNIYMGRTQTYDLGKERRRPWVMPCLRVTKELGCVAEVTFTANNFVNAHRYRTSNLSNALYQVYPSMYFGAEVKLKL